MSANLWIPVQRVRVCDLYSGPRAQLGDNDQLVVLYYGYLEVMFHAGCSDHVEDCLYR